MESNKVWRKCNKNDLPAGRRPVKCKWVFDIKRNDTFRARIVAKGFTQQPGLDYYLQCSPVVNDITFRIWLTCVLIWQLQTLVFDVETAFLHGSFCPGEEVHMNCPPGMVHHTDECLLLLKTSYGLIQVARHYFDFFSKTLVDIGFQQSPADPCLFLFKNALGMMLVIAHVDDVGLACSSYALVEFLFAELKKRKINYAVENDLTDYLSCEILFNKTRTKAWLGQPHLIKKLRTLFADKVSHLKAMLLLALLGKQFLAQRKGILSWMMRWLLLLEVVLECYCVC